MTDFAWLLFVCGGVLLFCLAFYRSGYRHGYEQGYSEGRYILNGLYREPESEE